MKADVYVSDGVPVIRGNNISDTKALAGDFAFVSEETADELRSSNVFAGDLVFPHRGAIGQVGIVPSGGAPRYMLSTSLMKLTCDLEVAEPRFVFYFFRSRVGRESLLAHASTVGTPGIAQPLTSLRSIRVPVPPLPEQLAIARVLESLDDKIELNRRMSETLEAVARALFKSWFVESLVDGIPAGWREGALGEIARHVKRLIPPEDIGPDTPYIALEHMPRGSISLSAWGTGEGLESGKFKFERGEILFGKLRPYFHKVGVAPVAGVCSTDIVVVAPDAPAWFGVVLGHLSSREFVDYTSAGSTGTRMPRTSWAEMSRYSIVIPPVSIAGEYTKLMAPLAERMLTAIHESRTLAALRDTLLPKLISGEIRVK